MSVLNDLKPKEIQGAVDLAYVLVQIKVAQRLGLLLTEIEVNEVQCEELITEAAMIQIYPRIPRALTALGESMPV